MTTKQHADLKNLTTELTARYGLQTAGSVINFLNSLPGRSAMTLVRATNDWMNTLIIKQHQAYFRWLHLRYLRLRLAVLARHQRHLKAKQQHLREMEAAAEEVLSEERATPAKQATQEKTVVLSLETLRFLQEEMERLNEEKALLSDQYNALLTGFEDLEDNDSLGDTLSMYTAEAFDSLIAEIKMFGGMFSSQIKEMDEAIAQHKENSLDKDFALSGQPSSQLPPPLVLQMNKLNDLIEASRKQRIMKIANERPTLETPLTPTPKPMPTPTATINKERVTHFFLQLSDLRNLIIQHQCQTMCCYEEGARRLQSILQQSTPIPRPEETVSSAFGLC